MDIIPLFNFSHWHRRFYSDQNVNELRLSGVTYEMIIYVYIYAYIINTV